jgi:hypothetical protein
MIPNAGNGLFALTPIKRGGNRRRVGRPAGHGRKLSRGEPLCGLDSRMRLGGNSSVQISR